MEFLIVSGLFFVYSVYIFIKPTKIKKSISEEEAYSYFFEKSEVKPNRIMTGLRTSGLGFYKDESSEVKVVKQSKLCDISII